MTRCKEAYMEARWGICLKCFSIENDESTQTELHGIDDEM